MSRRTVQHLLRVAAIIACVLSEAAAARQVALPAEGFEAVVHRFEQAVAGGDASAFLALLADDVNKDDAAAKTAGLFEPGATRVAFKEEDRVCDQDGCRLIVDVLREHGAQGRLSTWRLDVRRVAAAGQPQRWAISSQQRLSTVADLFKLSFHAPSTRVYRARGVTIEAEDLRITMTDGTVFVVEAAGRPTVFVAVGKGELLFTPAPAAERGQLRIFSGSETLRTAVDGLFVRLNPNEVDRHVKGLREPQTELRDLPRADELFRENNRLSFSVDLPGLSTDAWTLVPHEGDFTAEISTKRFGALTFSLAPSDPEDVLLFDRKARRNIAQYASRARLAARGPFYDDSQLADYEVTHYDVDARFVPARSWMDARVRLSIAVRANAVRSLTMRLADTLVVREATSPELGRLLPLRVHGREAIVVNLPDTVTRGTRLTVDFVYSGPIESQRLGGDVSGLDAGQSQRGMPERATPSPSYLFTNRPVWYPQPSFAGYATALVRITVPPPFVAVGSGDPQPSAGEGQVDAPGEKGGTRTFVFSARKPVQYLSLVISPLVAFRAERANATNQAGRKGVDTAASQDAGVDVTVQTNPDEKGLARDLHTRATDIVRFYAGLLGGSPYPALQVVLIEQDLPGGHSPGYVAAINYVTARTGVRWRNDPAYVPDFEEYFIAHEVAHQWWGQAVGAKNYHEQWLSEGFAQYFAALYAAHAHGQELFDDIVRSWQRWAAKESDQGPVYLGYRVGHIKADGRAFRAVVYNKGALVLQMLRQLVGDDAFFRGLRRFYGEFKFRKAGTDDFRRAMEAEAGTSLQRFFECWIYGAALPRVSAFARSDAAAAGNELVVRFEQEGAPFDVPVVLSLDYANRPSAAVTVRLNQARQEVRIPLAGSLRKVDLDRGTVAAFSRLSLGSGGFSR